MMFHTKKEPFLFITMLLGLATLAFAVPAVHSSSSPGEGDINSGFHPGSLTLWEKGPAEKWDRAYPVGNGRLGAMPWGTYPEEMILINEETIVQNDGPRKIREDAAEHFEIIKELVAEKKYLEAHKHFEKEILTGRQPYHYELAGWLKVHYPEETEIVSMRRSLDMETGIASNLYKLSDGNRISHRVYAGDPENVIVVEIKAEKPISFEVTMESPPLKKDAPGTLAVARHGRLFLDHQASGSEGPRYLALVSSHQPDAATAVEGALKFESTKSVTLLLTVATNVDREFPAAGPLPEGWQAKADEDLLAATSISVDQLRGNAVAAHQHYFKRVDLDLGQTSDEILALTIDERIKRLSQGGSVSEDPDLVEAYFQMGRYLTIGSSRPGTFPANLQGIWNPHMRPPWRSDYHLDINLQMNYWHAENTNLGELHQSVFHLIRSWQPQGKELAKRIGLKGWAMPLATDLWGSGMPSSTRARWTGNLLCGQWLAFHIMEHFRFNQDPAFLVDNWDLLTASVEFAEAWLIPGPDGKLVARPASSPENEFTYVDANGETQVAALSMGTSFDQYVILQVMNDYIEAAEALGRMDDPYVQQIAATIPKVYRPRIGSDGRLMEWMHDEFGENEPGHRHKSHLIGSFPGNQEDLDADPEMRAAVLKSLDVRLANGGGSAGVGWSRSWMIGMMARLGESEKAFESLDFILAKSTLSSLFNNKRPMQLEGNFGSTAGIAEMLLQSHRDYIKLLPALPAEHWADGSFTGLRARGDYTVDVSWADGKLASATITAGDHASGTVDLKYHGKLITLELGPGETAELDAASF